MKAFYKWKLREDVQFAAPGMTECVHEYLKVENEIATVKKGYAWNGCSPLVSIFDLFAVGTPNGVIDYKTGLPKCYYPSLIHDALYQYNPCTKEEADKIFLAEMQKRDFAPAKIYYWAVRLFGRRAWK